MIPSLQRNLDSAPYCAPVRGPMLVRQKKISAKEIPHICAHADTDLRSPAKKSGFR
jgi:hypothetical protein